MPAEETPVPNLQGPDQHLIQRCQEKLDRVRTQIAVLVFGQAEATEALLISLLCEGHVLVEGVPGIAKTMLAKLMAGSLQLSWSRIQFTPDLMPSDVIGTSVYEQGANRFEFRPGPVFAQVVLIDEINRAPAKTQSALFEVMEERQVTYDGKTHLLRPPFFVVATQNPVEQEGTYRLPEAQLDRFLFRIRMGYPEAEAEKAMLRQLRNQYSIRNTTSVEAMLSEEEVLEAQRLCESIYIAEELCDYIADIVQATRNHPGIYLGASPRASLALLRASKACALISGRSFTTPEDIQAMAYPVLNHRILLNSERELDGIEPEQMIREILERISVPR